MSSRSRWLIPTVAGIALVVVGGGLGLRMLLHERRLEEAKSARDAMVEACKEARSLEADREPAIAEHSSGEHLGRIGSDALARGDLSKAKSLFLEGTIACREAIPAALQRLVEEGHQAALEARREAEQAGAKELESFRQAEARLASGVEALETSRLAEAREEFLGSQEAFQHAALEAPAVHARDEARGAQSSAVSAGVEEENFSFSRGMKLMAAGTESIELQDFESAAESFLSAKASFEQALQELMALTPPGMVSFTGKSGESETVGAATSFSVGVGSTTDQIEGAVQLCRSVREVCLREWYETETPRQVKLEPFAIDRFEVTVEEFARFAEETGYKTTAEELGYAYRFTGKNWVRIPGYSWRNPQGADSSYQTQLDHPVSVVSGYDADVYCRWTGGRLPTASELEFAMRGHEGRVFPWGNDWDPGAANWNDGDEGGTKPVGSLSSGVTPEGVYDLAGNVWEWTGTAADGARVLKGGSWAEDNPANLRGAVQRLESPGDPHIDDGFRCARDLER